MKIIPFDWLLKIFDNPHQIAVFFSKHPQNVARIIDNCELIDLDTGRTIKRGTHTFDLSLLNSDQRKLLEQIYKEKGGKNV